MCRIKRHGEKMGARRGLRFRAGSQSPLNSARMCVSALFARIPPIMAALALCLSLMGCAQKMGTQPGLRPLRESAFFKDGQSARTAAPGTVPAGFTPGNRQLKGTPPVAPTSQTIPMPVTMQLLARGRERYAIYCAVCHGDTGDGDGMIVRRGYSRPPSFHTDNLRSAPVGHFYDVMTNGFGGMPSYAAQVEADDRWAIAAYIRALQLSQHATLDDVPPENRPALESVGQRP